MELQEKSKSDFYNILITPSMDMFLPAMVTMLSAIKNGGRPCHFYIMQSDFSEDSKEEYRKFIGNYPGNEVAFLDVNDEDFKIFKPWKGHYSTYYKLLAHEYLPQEVKKILYLDTDVMVRKNIEDFYFEDFEDNYFVAIWSKMEIQPRLKMRDFTPPKSVRATKKFTNSNPGVLLINSQKMKNDNIDIGVYKSALTEIGDDYWVDEGILNYLFHDKRKYVPAYKWQTMIGFIENYKYVFSLDKKQRTEQYNEFYIEDLDKKNELAIIHFVLAKCSLKPWLTICKDAHVYDETGKQLLPVEEPFFLEWWQIASELPKEYFWQLLVLSGEESRKKALKDVEALLEWTRNALSFCSSLCLDHMGERKFERFTQGLAGKKIAVLKFQDRAGQIFLKACENAGAKVVFKSAKAALNQLSGEEFEECKKADVVITCCVHGTKTHGREGVKCIDIWDVLRDGSLTKDLPAAQPADVSADTFAEEIKALRDDLYAQNTRLSERIIAEYHSGLAQTDALNRRIKELDLEKDRLNSELGRISCENELLRKNIKELESGLSGFGEENKTLSAQNEKLSSGLSEASEKLSSAEKRIGLLEEEKEELGKELTRVSADSQRAGDALAEAREEAERLKNTVYEMENSRSWRYTKIFRKNKKDEG